MRLDISLGASDLCGLRLTNNVSNVAGVPHHQFIAHSVGNTLYFHGRADDLLDVIGHLTQLHREITAAPLPAGWERLSYNVLNAWLNENPDHPKYDDVLDEIRKRESEATR